MAKVCIEDSSCNCKRVYNKENYDAFYQKLKSINWQYYSDLAGSSSNTDLSFAEFYSVFYSAFLECFPVRTQSNSYKNKHGRVLQPWYSQSIIKSCRKKSRLFKNYKKFPTTVNKIKYNNYKKTLKSCITLAECKYHQGQFLKSANDIRKTWCLINSILNKTSNQNNSLSIVIDNSLSKDANKIVNKFNDFFINIGPNLASTIPAVSKKPTDYLTSRNMNSMALKLTDKYEIDQTIKNLKNNTSPGSYEIPVSILKFAAGFIAALNAELTRKFASLCAADGPF